MTWIDECGNCRRPIPPRGNYRRRVPSLGGKVKIVCADCAREIDAQETLSDPETGKAIGTRPPQERLVA
jgi:RNase P subunit RPR2